MGNERWTMKVRHNKSHAVLADVERVGEHLRLLGVRPLDGDMPEVGHLIGAIFPDVAACRNALLAAMKGPVGDTLDNVLLSAAAYAAWLEKAGAAANRMVALGIAPDAIPDEMAKPLPDGSLLIWVDIPQFGRVSMSVPKEHWQWRQRPN